MGVGLNPAGNGSGESIAAIRSEMIAIHEHMLGRTAPDLLLDQLSQPGLQPSKTIDARHIPPAIAAELTPLNLELARTARDMRDGVISHRPLPLYQGC